MRAAFDLVRRVYFNPRSHEGSDHISPYKGCCRIYFNPRSHEGSDLVSSSNTLFMTISIHAPTRGATEERRRMRALRIMYFNPRSHEGSDASPVIGIVISSVFQSTLPRGERLGATATNANVPLISIHAPTRGATGRITYLVGCIKISIHAPTRGATAIFAKKFSFLSAKIV